MFGAAEADAFGSHFASFSRVLRRISVGAHAQPPHGVVPFHHGGVSGRQFGHDQRDLALIHRALTPIERDPVALAHDAPIDAQALLGVVDVDLLAAPDPAFAPTARDYRTMTRFPAVGGQDTL